MNTVETDRGSALERWSLIALSVLGAVLIGAAIWSLVRVFSDAADETVDRAAPSSSAPAAMNAELSQAEIDRQHAQYQTPAPVISKPIVDQAVLTPTNQKNDEIILRQEKTKVNQRIVERMKQYVRDNPNLDARDIENQIKKREKQSAPVP